MCVCVFHSRIQIAPGWVQGAKAVRLNSLVQVLSFSEPWDRAKIVRVGGQCLNLLSHTAGPYSVLLWNTQWFFFKLLIFTAIKFIQPLFPTSTNIFNASTYAIIIFKEWKVWRSGNFILKGIYYQKYHSCPADAVFRQGMHTTSDPQRKKSHEKDCMIAFIQPGLSRRHILRITTSSVQGLKTLTD